MRCILFLVPRLSDHSQHSAVAASEVMGALGEPVPKRRRGGARGDAVLEYADDTEHMELTPDASPQQSSQARGDGWTLVERNESGR